MNTMIDRRAFISALPAALLACTLPKADAAVSQQSVSEQPVSAIDNALSNLSLLNASSLIKLDSEVDKRNRSLLASFSAQLSSPTTSDDAKLYAAYYMGEFRFSAASDVLAEHITLKDNNLQRQNNDALWLWGRYPAMQALVKIGNPCLRAVLEGLSVTDDPLRRSLLLQVVEEICRYPECTKTVIGHAISSEPNSDRSARLHSALSHVV